MKALPYNPYDFANPVDKPTSFAGRKSQTEDISYYLNHALYTRPIHLALTGERSAGKTSMLNMIHKQATEEGFLVVRLDLNEGDSDPVEFFGRLYDSLLTAAIVDGKFGGFGGTTWSGYRSLVDANAQGVDLQPLNFPSHWAVAHQGTRSLSEAVLGMDLRQISTEAAKKIIIILDECDVLSQKKITLQILRNVFMNLDGYMLVIAGTPRLFPVFDDVFSPINRQFKKITISPFDDVNDTRECISRPLTNLGTTPRSIIRGWPRVVEEIHQVTGGRPYEIQLLCHTMFRRVQEKSDSRMSLSVEVLDEVRLDLENRQGHDTERFSRRYSGLSERNLMSLAILRRVDDGNLDAAFTVHSVDPWPGHSNIDKEEFLKQINELVSLGVLDETAGVYKLAGDQFDEVYLRYLAASRGLRIPPWQLPPETIIAFELLKSLKPLSHLSPYLLSKDRPEAFRDDALEQLSSMNDVDPESDSIRWSNIVIALRQAQENNSETIQWASVEISLGDIKFVSHFYLGDGIALKDFESISEFRAFRDRIVAAGGNIVISFERVSIAHMRPLDELLVNDIDARKAVASIYSEHGFELYLDDAYDLSYSAFCDAHALEPKVSFATAAAFLSLQRARWEEAIQWTKIADEQCAADPDKHQLCLAAYDRALAKLMLHDIDGCVSDLQIVQSNWSEEMADSHNYLLRAVDGDTGEWELRRTSGTLIDLSNQLNKKLMSKESM